MFLDTGASVRYGLIWGTRLVIIRVSGVRVHPPLPFAVNELGSILAVTRVPARQHSRTRFNVWFRVFFGHQRIARLCRRLTRRKRLLRRPFLSLAPCPSQ